MGRPTIFKNYSVNIQQFSFLILILFLPYLKTTQIIFNAHKIKPHNIYQSLYS